MMRMLDSIQKKKKFQVFHFEAVWLKDEACEGIIKKAWSGQNFGELVGRLIGKVEACRSSLQKWSRLSFGNITHMIIQKKKQLAQAETKSMAEANHEEIRVLRSEVHELMVKEECLWHQRSRADWLKRGDMNMSYFHS